MTHRINTSDKVKKSSRRASSNDVARLAGVSQAAVSRAFTPGASVSDEMRAKVLAAARKLGYKPNAIARSLVMQRTSMIAVVMANLWNPFYSRILEQLTERLQAIGYWVLLLKVTENQEPDDALVRALEYQADGIIMTSATMSTRMADECVERDTPLVLFNRYALGTKANAVCCDNVTGGRLVADALLDAGHTRLAYMAGEATSSTNRDRESGFRGRLQERGYADLASAQGDYTYESGVQAAEQLLNLPEPPDAIFCANDLMAMGALDYIKDQCDVTVPDNVSIVGFDDIPMASWPHYSLTTVRQPVERMVAATIEVLMAAIASPQGERILRLIPGELVERSTTRLASP